MPSFCRPGPCSGEDAAAWVAFGAAASTRPWLADPYWEALQIMRPGSRVFWPTLGRPVVCAWTCHPPRERRLVTAVVNGLTLDLLNAPPTESDEVIGQLRSGLGLILRGL